MKKKIKKKDNVEREIDEKKTPKIATYSNLCKSLLIIIPQPPRTAPSLSSDFFSFPPNWLKITPDVVDSLYFHSFQGNFNCQKSYG